MQGIPPPLLVLLPAVEHPCYKYLLSHVTLWSPSIRGEPHGSFLEFLSVFVQTGTLLIRTSPGIQTAGGVYFIAEWVNRLSIWTEDVLVVSCK